MNQTTNYSLPQWEASDRVTRGDMNDAMSAIDTALAVKCEIVFGKYTGNGSYPRTIELGFTPKAVLLERLDGSMGSGYGGFFGPGHPLKSNSTNNVTYAEVVNGGIVLTGGNTNQSGTQFFQYMAFK